MQPMEDSALSTHAAADATSELIKAEDAGTLWGLFRERLRRSPDAIAYRDYQASAGGWRDHSWRMIAARVDRFRAALAKEGMQPGDRVAVLLPNGIDWVCFDMAAQAQGLVVVGLYPDDSAVNHAYILAHSETRLALVDNWPRWAPLRALSGQFPRLARVWIRDASTEAKPAADEIVRPLAAVLSDASEIVPAHEVAPSALATLIYTSGTTGGPKGAMLSHAALIWNAAAVAAVIPPRRDDVFLSILPLAHAFERTVGCYLAMLAGATVAFGRAPQTLAEDMNALHPTVLLGVPRLFERLYAAIRAQSEASWIGASLLRLFAWLGWKRFEAQQKPGGTPSLGVRLLHDRLDRLIGERLKARLGGRLRVVVSGGAALDPNVARFLIGIGLPLVEGYGLTEAGPVVTASPVTDAVPGSVGRPLPGVEVKLGTADELLVRSPSLMLGYWKDEEATGRTLLASGWLATGDIASLTGERVSIRGRLKDIIILSIGEKINPCPVETEIAHDALVQQITVIGDGRPFLAALAVFDPMQWQAFARASHLDAAQPNAPKVKELILARWAKRLAALPRHAQIRAVHLSLDPWTVDAGLLTPTLKARRHALEQRFAVEIEALYATRQIPKPG